MTSARREETATNLDLVGKLSVAVIPLSFVIGLAVIAGECLAIGGPAWSFVGFSDVIAAATKSAPIAFILLATVTIAFAIGASRASARTSLTDQAIHTIDLLSKVRNWIVITVAVTGVSIWFFLDWKSAVVFDFLMALNIATAQIISASAGSRLPRPIVGLGLALLCAVSVAAISYALTKSSLLKLPQTVQTHTICWDVSDPRKCEYGLVVTRFSDTTVFRGNDGGFNYIQNSEIKRFRGIIRDQSATSDR